MALPVHRPAVASQDDWSGLSVAEFFTEKLKTKNVVAALALGGRVTARNHQGFTPLLAAAQHGHTEICGLLLANGSNVNDRDTQGFTPLLSAALHGHTDICGLLLAHGSSVNEVVPETKHTALHYASCDEVVKSFCILGDDQAKLVKRPEQLLEEGFKCDKLVKMQECFRMPFAKINHIDSEKVLPTDIPEAQNVESQGVMDVNINLPVGFSSQWLANQLAEQLHKRVMQRGIHPGHCAVLFDQGAVNQLFPAGDGGLPNFMQHLNSSLNVMTANKKARCMLQVSQEMEEIFEYRGNQLNTTSSFDSVNLVAESSLPGSNPSIEETSEFWTERHAEVKSRQYGHNL